MGDAESRRGTLEGLHGPYYRLASPTQTRDDARLQVESGELWGRTPRLGIYPRVEAFEGPLPEDAEGIEFLTPLEPDLRAGRKYRGWTAIVRDDVRIDGDFAKIPCVITRVHYRTEPW